MRGLSQFIEPVRKYNSLNIKKVVRAALVRLRLFTSFRSKQKLNSITMPQNLRAQNRLFKVFFKRPADLTGYIVVSTDFGESIQRKTTCFFLPFLHQKWMNKTCTGFLRWNFCCLRCPYDYGLGLLKFIRKQLKHHGHDLNRKRNTYADIPFPPTTTERQFKGR